MTELTLEYNVHFRTGHRGRKRMRAGTKPAPPNTDAGIVPRISRLMAMAIRFEHFVREGQVHDYANLARLGHVTRARLTQIMNLRLLAPDIQEAILFLPRVPGERSGLCERHVRKLAAIPDWAEQRRRWKELTRACRLAT
jgi:hypothetical protein